MKKVKEMKESQPEKSEYFFDLTLEDGHTSKIKLMKEMGEWILVGDSRQHFCEDELEIILDKIEDLNIQDDVDKEEFENIDDDFECDGDCDNCTREFT